MKSYLLPVALFVLVGMSCKKDVATDTNVPAVLSIYNTGVNMVGNEIRFSSNAGAGNKFLWNFGDSTTSTEARPIHMYKTAGSRTVSLTLNRNTAATVSKYIGVYYDPLYTHLVEGVRTWQHTYVLNRSGMSPSNITYNDTTFEVRMIDPVSIAIGEDSLSYYESTDSTLSFSKQLQSNSYNRVVFNHRTNVVLFTKFQHIGASANSTETYKSP